MLQIKHLERQVALKVHMNFVSTCTSRELRGFFNLSKTLLFGITGSKENAWRTQFQYVFNKDFEKFKIFHRRASK